MAASRAEPVLLRHVKPGGGLLLNWVVASSRAVQMQKACTALHNIL